MNDPQIWTLIGVFAAIVVGGMSIMTTLLGRSITAAVTGLRAEMAGLRAEVSAEIGGLRGEMGAEIGGLRGEIRSLRAEMDARFEAVNYRFDAVDTRITGLHTEMNTRFESMGARIDHLDRDVAALTVRVWGGTSEH